MNTAGVVLASTVSFMSCDSFFLPASLRVGDRVCILDSSRMPTGEYEAVLRTRFWRFCTLEPTQECYRVKNELGMQRHTSDSAHLYGIRQSKQVQPRYISFTKRNVVTEGSRCKGSL